MASPAAAASRPLRPCRTHSDACRLRPHFPSSLQAAGTGSAPPARCRAARLTLGRSAERAQAAQKAGGRGRLLPMGAWAGAGRPPRSAMVGCLHALGPLRASLLSGRGRPETDALRYRAWAAPGRGDVRDVLAVVGGTSPGRPPASPSLPSSRPDETSSDPAGDPAAPLPAGRGEAGPKARTWVDRNCRLVFSPVGPAPLMSRSPRV